MSSLIESRPSNLRMASRIVWPRSQTSLLVIELICLLALGSLSMVLVSWWHPQLRIPGSAILRASLPMLIGVAVFPRARSGLLLSLGATLCYGLLLGLGVRVANASAASAVVVFGPLLSTFLTCRPSTRFPLYLRCALAGGFANGIAYLVRFQFMSSFDAWGITSFASQFGNTVFLSFLLCGLLSGLVFAPFVFKFESHVQQ